MHDVEAKNQPKHSGECLLLRSAFKSLIVQAVDYPAYAMVICQHSDIKDVNNICWLIHGNLQSYRQVKTSIVICSAIFDRKGKNDGYFRQFWLVSTSILPASNQTQRCGKCGKTTFI